MGRIAKVLAFFRTIRDGAFISRVELKSTAKVIYTSDNFQDSGSDSQPLPGDFAVAVNTVKTGSSVSVGYVDPKNAGVSGPGEKRIYSRDENGFVKAAIHLKSDGEIEMNNPNGFIKIRSDGVIDINGALFSPSSTADIENLTSDSILVDGKELKDHTHPVTSAPGTTGPNNP